MNSRLYSLTALAVVLAACSEAPVTPQATTLRGGQRLASVSEGRSYVILMGGNDLSTGFSVQVGNAGGTVTASFDKIGIALASSTDADFASKALKIKGVQAVVPNVMLQYSKPTVGEELTLDALPPASAEAAIGAGETFRNVQWWPDAVNAPAAWAAGYLGHGARVAIVDGGISSGHVDIAPNLDVAHSASCVAGKSYDQDGSGFRHATHVGGIVAAPNNGIGTIGIAPEATLIGVKALNNGTGDFGAVICAIYYAATPIAEGGAGANVINMSLGGDLIKSGVHTGDPNQDYTAADAASLINAISRATSYANQRGVTVVASAGNDAIDFDHSSNLFDVPAQAVGVLTVAASAPQGWALGATNYSRPASYTNYGQSAVDLSAPGGDDSYYYTNPPASTTQVCSKPRIPSGTVNQFCWVFDYVFSSGSGTTTYNWAAGTSMAAPVVSGVAALIYASHPGIKPAQVEAMIRQSATDVGKPGNDDFSGAGFVNAAKAVQQ